MTPRFDRADAAEGFFVSSEGHVGVSRLHMVMWNFGCTRALAKRFIEEGGRSDDLGVGRRSDFTFPWMAA